MQGFPGELRFFVGDLCEGRTVKVGTLAANGEFFGREQALSGIEDLLSLRGHGESHGSDEQWNLQKLQAFVESRGSFVFVAEETIPLGVLLARSSGEEAEVYELLVAPQRRREGVAENLMALTIETFGKSGVSVLHLEVREGNEAARAFYKKQSFLEVGRRHRYYKEPLDNAVLMKREIKVIK